MRSIFIMKRMISLLLLIIVFVLLSACDPGSFSIDKESLNNVVNIELVQYTNPNQKHFSSWVPDQFDKLMPFVPANATVLESLPSEKTAEFLNQKYGEGTVTVLQKDSYYNMKEKVEPEYFFLVEHAKKCMEELDIIPRIQPIRGGTDGARLSYMGLPCPNLCAGGHNFHGRYEYVCVESMEKIVELLVKLAAEKYV